ncbi:hemerythrin domain-containing protein [Phycicoccus sp. CSK15P-2]|uniref:hemerythrin domain-containing protein n=1 Tax=Phycicoccus sp. CSK15P-2 TaxID=2807627 RepID=UPI00194DB0BC|nr:hemerythrin domain-containing protein [Phycicoccus sp. CSK15P-2]MBM6404952.1 hemerythrin domain-containing protein [Phycicoccus sp. CSK15P-2]
MDAAFAAHLERVRARRGELGESMAALDAALSLPVGLGPVWRRRVRAALTELAHDLRDHVSLTEAPDGLYADLRAHAPRIANGVEAQLREHEEFLGEVDRLLGQRDEGFDGPEAVAAHREAATALIGRLVRHRQRGSDLIYAAYDVDIGGSD